MYIPGEPFASATALSAQTNFDFFWDCHAVENCRRRKQITNLLNDTQKPSNLYISH